MVWLQSLKNKLLLAVACLVIGTGVLVSLLVTHRYSKSTFEAMKAQAENIAHGIALEAADKILINDLVDLQKMLTHYKGSHPSIAYLLVLKDLEILAHTFTKGVPVELLKANFPHDGTARRFQRITATTGEHYLDIAWPIFEGRAGVLRFGLSEEPYRRQVVKLWIQMSALTAIILLLALAGALLFIRRVTMPLTELAEAAKRIDQGDLSLRVRVSTKDEVGTMALAFNQMVESTEKYMKRLEEQSMELERAYRQTRAFCSIVQEIGAMRTLREIGSLLIARAEDILKCGQKVLLLVFNSQQDVLFLVSKEDIGILEDASSLQVFQETLRGLLKPTFVNRELKRLSAILEFISTDGSLAIAPLYHEKASFGALIIDCYENCQCSLERVDTVSLILMQAAGVIKRAVLQEEEAREFQSRLRSPTEFAGIVGKDPKMQVIYRLIEDIASTDTTVLIQGESGTGKELAAWAIHRLSPRNGKPFVVINCSAYPATLLESELFGHERGAFTGAIRQKPGRFEQADGGTVFIDEVGEMSLSAQIKLLRVLQAKKFERLGGEKTISVDVRILAATNKDLLQEVKAGRFREDLFYRLNVIPIQMPPLSERPNDIPLLARHFLKKFASDQGKVVDDFSQETMRLYLEYPWPGNVRELQNIVEHAVVLAKSNQIEPQDLPSSFHAFQPTQRVEHLPTLAEQERELLHDTLVQCAWNKKETARKLGISRNTLYMKLKKHRIFIPTAH